MYKKIDFKKERMEFCVNLIDVYKTLVFKQKEYVFSKRLLQAGIEMCNLINNSRLNSWWIKAVETRFWLEFLKTMFLFYKVYPGDEKEILYRKLDVVSEELSLIINYMENGTDEKQLSLQ